MSASGMSSEAIKGQSRKKSDEIDARPTSFLNSTSSAYWIFCMVIVTVASLPAVRL